ncbi:hypothetical protein ACE2AJ_11130 [Aquihabitans daechungensis]|uniref:hypothetical protein n=1 Tax=Aquihabitans daechungensis TaxID=1052257 RepID=UPI003B9F44AC
MTTPTLDPAPAPTPTDARPAPRGLLRATAVIATIGVVVALLGLVLLLRPVSTPTQDCGTSLAFLLDGRVNEFVSESDPPPGVTAAEAKANNDEPCRDRVAERTKPAAVLLGAGLVAAIGAAVVETAVRTTAWVRRRRARRSASESGPAT